MKIFKVMPIFAALIALSACPTAPNGEGGTPGPDVVLKPGDNADESGNIKPEAGSPTTKEFLALFNKGFRGTDLKTLAVKEEGGAYTIAMDEGTVITLDSLKTPTHAIFRREMPIDDAGTVTATQYIGIVVDQKTVWQLEWLNDYESEYPGNGASDAQKKAFYTKLYAKSNIDWDGRQNILAALAPAPADVSAFVAKVNGARFKGQEYKENTDITLKPFSLESDGSFKRPNSGPTPETYNIFYFEDENTVQYARPGSGSTSIRLEEFRFVELNSSGDSIIAAKPNPALLAAFVKNVNDALLWHHGTSGEELFTLANDGSFSQSMDRTERVFYMIDGNTANYTGSSLYGLRGAAKFGRIEYELDENNQQTSVERPLTSPTAVKKANTVDAAALPGLKAALAGIYTPFTINYPSSGGGGPTTNYGAPFTINADGSFTDATLHIYGSDKTITAATLDSARSAAEGRYSATIDGSPQHIGLEIINGMLYITGSTSSGIDSLNWLQMTAVAEKQQ